MADIGQLLAGAATNPNALLVNLLLPFLFIFAVIWGLLSMIRIFKGPEGGKINIVIALVLTIMAIVVNPLGFTTVLTNFLANFAMWAFAGTFVFLIIIWALRSGKESWDAGKIGDIGKKNYDDVRDLDKELGKMQKKFEQLKYQGREAEANHILETIMELRKKKEILILGKDFKA